MHLEMNVHEVIKNAICKIAPGIDESKIVPKADLTKDLAIDSLAKVELAMALEDSCNLTLSDEELGEVVTVGDIIALLESNLGNSNA